MQRHLKTFLLHHELKHKEGFINDPESPGWLSVALVNWTIVCSAFASQTGIIHYVFSSCQPSLLQIHHVLCFCTSQFRKQFDSSGWTVWIILGKSFQSNVLNLHLRVIYCLKGNEKVFVFGNRCGEKQIAALRSMTDKNKTKTTTTTKKKHTFVYLECGPFKSSNCFLFQVTLGTSFTATCWTSNRGSEPLWAERWSAACWSLSDVFALGISLEDVYKCHCGELDGEKRDLNSVFLDDTLSWIVLLICWVHTVNELWSARKIYIIKNNWAIVIMLLSYNERFSLSYSIMFSYVVPMRRMNIHLWRWNNFKRLAES